MKKNLSIAALATVIMFFILRWEGASLMSAISPRGIVDLEFADTPQRFNELMNSWNLSVVRGNIWLDFLFIVSYVLCLSMATEASAMKWPEGTIRFIGFWLARAAYVAGVMDIAENLLMLQSIAGNVTVHSLHLTSYCAALKFFIVGILLLYLFLSLPMLLRKTK